MSKVTILWTNTLVVRESTVIPSIPHQKTWLKKSKQSSDRHHWLMDPHSRKFNLTEPFCLRLCRYIENIEKSNHIEVYRIALNRCVKSRNSKTVFSHYNSNIVSDNLYKSSQNYICGHTFHEVPCTVLSQAFISCSLSNWNGFESETVKN